MKINATLALLSLITTTFTLALEPPTEPATPPTPTPVVEEEEAAPASEPEQTVDPSVRLVLEALHQEREQNQKELLELRKQQQELLEQLAELRKEQNEEVAETPMETPAPRETILLQERDPKLLRLHPGNDQSENYTRQQPADWEIRKMKITGYVVGPRKVYKTPEGFIERRPVLCEDDGRMVVAKGRTPELEGMTLEPISVLMPAKDGDKFVPFWFVVDNTTGLN